MIRSIAQRPRRAAAVLAAAVVLAVPRPGHARQDAGAAPVLTIEEAVAAAQARNRPLAAARHEIAKAGSDLAAMRTNRRPKLDVTAISGTLVSPLTFSFATGVFGTFPSTGPVPGQDTRISTNPRFSTVVFARGVQPLSDLHRIGLAAQALDLQQEIARERARTEAAALDANVKRLYYGIVQAEAAVTAQEKSLALHRELERLMQEYVRQQTVLPASGLAATLALAQQDHQALVLRNSIRTYREQLNALLGRDLDTPFALAPLAADSVPQASSAEAETRAVEARPEARIARLQARQAEIDWRVTRAKSLPQVSVAFNYLGFYNFDVLPRHGAMVGLLGTWDPWDWGRGRHEAASKRETIEQATLAAAEAESRIRLDVRARARAAEEARDQMRVADLSRGVAGERLRVALDRFKQDSSLEREALEAQAALAAADQQYQQALAAFWTARADLERASGEN